MIEINIQSTDLKSAPIRHVAYLGEKLWPGGGTVPILKLSLGGYAINVWPANKAIIAHLGRQLIDIAEEME